jgi:hypothetical protein
MPQPLAPTPPEARRRRPHWIAGTFYLILAVGGIVVAAQGKPAALFATLLCGLYAAYLYRGGRIVVWFW